MIQISVPSQTTLESVQQIRCSLSALGQRRADAVRRLVRIDVGELAQPVFSVERLTQIPFDALGRPFGVEGVGVGDVDVHVRARTARVALRPLEEMQRDGASMYEPVSRATLVRLDVKAEALVSV